MDRTPTFRHLKDLITEAEFGTRAPIPDGLTKSRQPSHLTSQQRRALVVIRQGPTTTKALAVRLGLTYLSTRSIVTVLRDRGLVITQPSVGGGICAKETT